MPLDLDNCSRFFSRLNIRDRDSGARIPFKLRPQQQELTERCKQHLEAKRRLYVIFLKARRVGISTWASAIQLAHCASKPDSHAAIIAQQRETAAELFLQASGFAKDLRALNQAIDLKKNRIIYPYDKGEDSDLRHYTAATVHGTRGLTFSSVHMTEAAFYPYDGAYTAIINTLSKKDPETICIIETTANGMEGPGEAYYEYWQAAEAGDNEFLPIFLPWYEDAEYVADPEGAADAPRDDYEKYLMGGIKDHRTGKIIKLGKERIAWFRQTLYTSCEGSMDRWKSEYPSTPHEAFISTGSPAFSHEEITFANNSVAAPVHYGLFELDTFKKPQFIPHTDAKADDYWLIWEFPQPNTHYFFGVDTARGEEVNLAPGDFAAIVGWNAETGEQACRYMGRISPEKIAAHASMAGRFYNDALLNVELNNLGYVVMRELRDRLMYPNQYRWKGRDDKFDGKVGTAFGFETSDRYRRMMFNLYRTALYRKECVPKDKELVRQMTNTKMEMGFRWNVAVGHDDVFMAGLLGWIAKEQFHPHVCKNQKPRNLLLTSEELSSARLAMSGKGNGQGIAGLTWLADSTSTADGSLMMSANDHLRMINRYEKKKREPLRLAGI